jgi:hypothetical protein
LSWFINTSIPSNNSFLPRLGNATIAWDFLAKRYNCTYDASLEFQLKAKLYQMRQKPSQSISDFYSQTNHLWEQLSAANPKLECPKDIQTFATWLDRRKFMHIMMALRDDFESTRASLLHCQPLPTLDATVSELISEETRRSTMKMLSSDMVLATASHGTSQSSTRHSSSHSTSKTDFCKLCKHNGHTISECRRLQRYKQKQASQQTAAVVSPAPSAPETPSQSTSLTAANVKDLIHLVLFQSSTALSVTPGKSQWFIDSAYCNHMTSDSTIFSHKAALSPNPAIYTADGSHMPVNHIGSISTSNLSVSDTYLVPKLSLNLLSVGKLCEQLKFSNKGVDVHDSRTG